MVGQFLRIERDAHRHALDDLDPVAGGILRRQQREGAARARAQALDMAVIGDTAAIDIGGDGHRLADAHVLQLHFLEIGVDPDIGQRHHRHQRRARRDLLADLDGALGDHAIHRRDDAHMDLARWRHCATAASAAQHIGIVGDIGALDLRQGLVRPALARGQRGFRGLDHCRGHAPVPRPTPRRRRKPPGGADSRSCACASATCGLRHLGAPELCAWENSPLTVAYGARQIGLGGRHVHIRHRGIHFDQELAALHRLGVVGMQRHHAWHSRGW